MYAANCGYPTSVDNSLKIVGYNAPMLEGSNISFSCLSQCAFIDPNASTCMGNGEWKPDPRNLKCAGIILSTVYELYDNECSSKYGPPRTYIFPYNIILEGEFCISAAWKLDNNNADSSW